MVSNWREDLREIVDEIETKAEKKVKDTKGINNKIVINPKLDEAVKEIGGELLEVKEVDVDQKIKDREKEKEDEKKNKEDNAIKSLTPTGAKEDPSLKQKEKQANNMKKRVLLQKLRAVRSGAGDSIMASHEPEGEMVEAVLTKKDKKKKEEELRRLLNHAIAMKKGRAESVEFDEGVKGQDREARKEMAAERRVKGNPSNQEGDPSKRLTAAQGRRSVKRVNYRNEEVVLEKDLSAAERRALPNKDFVFPGKGEGPEGKQRGAYPINDKKHARAALAMAAAHASPEKEAKVKAAVKKKYPDIEVSEGKLIDKIKNWRGKKKPEKKATMDKTTDKLHDWRQKNSPEQKEREKYVSPFRPIVKEGDVHSGQGEKIQKRTKAWMDKKGQKGAPGLDAIRARTAEHKAKRGVKEDWKPEIEHSKLGDAKKKKDKERESKLPPHLQGDALGKMKKAFASEAVKGQDRAARREMAAERRTKGDPINQEGDPSKRLTAKQGRKSVKPVRSWSKKTGRYRYNEGEDKAFNYVVAKLKKQHGDGVLTKGDKMPEPSAAQKKKNAEIKAKRAKEDHRDPTEKASDGRYSDRYSNRGSD